MPLTRITSGIITDGTVSTADIADSAITTAKIAPGAVVTADLADGAVTTAKIADSSVTPAKIASTVSLVPAGAVMPFAMNTAPSGWLAADGTAVSRTTYASLFSAIGTTHGTGDGSTTFNLPDLRGIFVRGSGAQTVGGIAYNKSFAAKEADAMQGHVHNFTAMSGSASLGAAGGGNVMSGTTSSTTSPVSDGTNGTPRTASETRPANIALLYCIKF